MSFGGWLWWLPLPPSPPQRAEQAENRAEPTGRGGPASAVVCLRRCQPGPDLGGFQQRGLCVAGLAGGSGVGGRKLEGSGAVFFFPLISSFFVVEGEPKKGFIS